MARSRSAVLARVVSRTRRKIACLLRRLASLFHEPRKLPWKRLATRLRLQRDASLSIGARQKRLLVWLLNQIAAEAQAAKLLADETPWDGPRKPRGQA